MRAPLRPATSVPPPDAAAAFSLLLQSGPRAGEQANGPAAPAPRCPALPGSARIDGLGCGCSAVVQLSMYYEREGEGKAGWVFIVWIGHCVSGWEMGGMAAEPSRAFYQPEQKKIIIGKNTNRCTIKTVGN